MKAVRFSGAEVTHLRSVLLDTGVGARILAKLVKAETAPVSIDVRALENRLIETAAGRVIALCSGWALASRRAAAIAPADDDIRAMGRWLSCQHWLTGPLTLLDVLNKWDSWLPKARNHALPGVPAGLRSHVPKDNNGRGVASSGEATPRRRQAPGFRRKVDDARADRLPGD